jgi:hypothetical protein
MDDIRTPLLLRGLALLFSVLGLANNALAAAIVTDVTGQARAANNNQAIVLLSEIAPGTELVLSAGARLTLIHTTAQSTIALTGPGTYSVLNNAIVAQSGAPAPAATRLPEAFRDVRLKPSRVAQASIAMRGGGSDDRLRLLSPYATWLLDQRAVLRWESKSLARSFAVQVTDSENRVLFDTVTRERVIALPERIVLEPGRLYGWQVKASLSDGEVLEAWSEFGIADQMLRAKAEAARPAGAASNADRVAYALLLEALNFRDAAREEWGRIARDRPADTQLRALAEGR